MLRRTSSRKNQTLRREVSTRSVAEGCELGPVPLHLELPVPDAAARYSNSMSTTPAEKPAGSCVIVINLHGEDSDDE